MEALFELLGELLLDLVAELAVEFGAEALVAPFRRRRETPALDGRPDVLLPARRARESALVAAGYLLYGSAAGGLSLLVFHHLLVPAWFRGGSFVLSTLASGALMMATGAWRDRRRRRLRLRDVEAPSRLGRFACGLAFGAAFSLIRFLFAA